MNSKKKLCMILVLLMLVQLISFFNINVSYADNEPPYIESPSCILVEATNGENLYEKNSAEKMFPASTTKAMTAILTLEHCDLNDKVTVSHSAVSSIPYSYTTAKLQVGEVFTVEQLLYCLLLPSANDAANVLAEHVGGSIQSFADMMNAKALEIGCKNTHFVNPSGIHNENHYTTAYDLAQIGRYAMKMPAFMKILQTTTYSLPATNIHPDADRTFTTSNALISKNSQYYYEYATGLKTGYTDTAKSCIISTAEKDGVQFVCVILGASSQGQRDTECKNLFNYAFSKYQYKTVKAANDVAKTIKIKNASSETRELNILVKDDIRILLDSSMASNDLFANIQINDNLLAPISKNQVIGKISYVVNGQTYSSDLIAANDVYQTELLSNLLKVLVGILLVLVAGKLALSTNKKDSAKKTQKGKRSKSKTKNKDSVKKSSQQSKGKKHKKGFNFKFNFDFKPKTKADDNDLDIYGFDYYKPSKNYRKNPKE